MKYLGSKKRYAKYILPIILRFKGIDQTYIEPFCGGCNMLENIRGKRIASDDNFYLIEMYKALQDNWVPPRISKEEYLKMKKEPDKFPKHLIGFAGSQLSFGAMWFASYRTPTPERDYQQEAINGVLSLVPKIKGVDFRACDYRQLDIPEASLIYCDPPYLDSIKMYLNTQFNHNKFYDWCITKKNQGHTVFISEHYMPEDRFECVLEIPVTHRLNKRNESKIKRVEKLFKPI